MVVLSLIGGVYFLVGCHTAEMLMDEDMRGMHAAFFGTVWPIVFLIALYNDFRDGRW